MQNGCNKARLHELPAPPTPTWFAFVCFLIGHPPPLHPIGPSAREPIRYSAQA